jgi:dihydrofolate synthase/folylpolyglutamate synthase
VSIRERIRLGGTPLEEKDFVHLVRRLAPVVEKLEANGEQRPSFFEAFLAMALLYFRRQKVQVSILEVGLGGRLDATSVISPLVAVITNISRDHMAILGDTLVKITVEKAGIIKEEGVVVSCAQEPEVRDVLLQTARDKRAILFLGSEDFFVKGRAYTPTSTHFDYFGLNHTWEDLEVSLAGHHQAENAATALAVLECLDELWGFTVEEEAVRTGLKNVSWPGRLEVVSWQPLVVLDGAHNPRSAEALKAALGEVFPQRKVVLVFGTGQDKEYQEMAEVLWPAAESVIVTQSGHPRALEASRLAQQCSHLAGNLTVQSDYRQAFQDALLLADKDSLVCVAGSLFLVGDIKAQLEVAGAIQELPLPAPGEFEEQLSLFPTLAAQV